MLNGVDKDDDDDDDDEEEDDADLRLEPFSKYSIHVSSSFIFRRCSESFILITLISLSICLRSCLLFFFSRYFRKISRPKLCQHELNIPLDLACHLTCARQAPICTPA